MSSAIVLTYKNVIRPGVILIGISDPEQ